jgi:hypothetical protein
MNAQWAARIAAIVNPPTKFAGLALDLCAVASPSRSMDPGINPRVSTPILSVLPVSAQPQ